MKTAKNKYQLQNRQATTWVKQNVKTILRNGCDMLAVELVDVAVQLSSGTLDSAKAGHPYSRAHPNKAYDPAYINIGFKPHSGRRFAEAWETLPASEGPGIRNTSDVGPFLEHGTSRMVKRPVDQLIKARADQIYARHLDQAFRAAQVNLSIATVRRAPTLLRPAAS